MGEKREEEEYIEPNIDVHDVFDDYQPKIEDITEQKPDTLEPSSNETVADKSLSGLFASTRRKVTEFVMGMKRDPEQEAEEISPDETFLPDPKTKIMAWAEKLKQVDESDIDDEFVLFSRQKKSKEEKSVEPLKTNETVIFEPTEPSEEPINEKHTETVSDDKTEEVSKSSNIIYSAPVEEPKPEKGPDLMQVAVRNTEIKPELLRTPPVQDLTLDEIIANEMRIKTFSAQRAETENENLPHGVGAFAYRDSVQGEKVIEQAPPQPIASMPLEEQQRVQETLLKQAVNTSPKQTAVSESAEKAVEPQQTDEPTEEFSFVRDYSKPKTAVKSEEKPIEEPLKASVSESAKKTAELQKTDEPTEEFSFVRDYSKPKTAVKSEENPIEEPLKATVSENAEKTVEPQKTDEPTEEFSFVRDYSKPKTAVKSEENPIEEPLKATVSESTEKAVEPQQTDELTEEFSFVQDYSKPKMAVKSEENPIEEPLKATVSESAEKTAELQKTDEPTEEFSFVQDYSKPKMAVNSEEKLIEEPLKATVSENAEKTVEPQKVNQSADETQQSNDEFMFVKDCTEKFKQAKAARKAAQRAAAVSGNPTPKVEFGIGDGDKRAEEMHESVNDNHAERAEPVLMYHPEYEYRNFCVMAGKFTKIVRSEYRVYRFLDKSREQAIQTPTKTEKVEKIAEEKVTQPEIVIATVPRKPEQSAKSKIPTPQTEKTPIISQKSEKKPEKKAESKKAEFTAPILMPRDIDEVETEENRKAQKPKRSSKKSGKKRIAKLFSDEESFDESEYDTVEEQKKTIDEYRNRDEEKEIRFQLNESVRSLFWRELIIFILFIASTVLSLLVTFAPNLFSGVTYGWLVAGFINFIILAVGIVVCRVPIINGLMPLRAFKGNSDTALTVSAFAILVESVAAMFYPNVFINGTYPIYTPLLMLALFLNTFGKVMMITRVRDNFKFLTKPYVKYSGKIFTDIKTANKMAEPLPISHPIIAYQKKTKFMSDFLKLSYAPDPSEEYASKLAPIAAVVSVVVGILYGIIHADAAGAMTSFALTACITTPICSLLAVNIPMSRLCKSAGRKSAMVSNYAAVRQFCDTNAIIVDVNDLYPKGTITLSGMKIFNESKINDALLAGAAVSFAAKGTFAYVFENIIQGRMEILPKVESVLYEDNMGLVGWVEGERVLIGNRKLMEMHNVSIPKVEYETMYKGREIAYLSVGGDLCALLVLSYRADRETAAELQKLQDCGVCLVVRTLDCNITPNHIAEKFRLYPRCITVLPTALGQIADEAKSGMENETRAYLATRGRLSSFARAITGCIKIRSSVKLSIIIQAIGIIFGFIVVTAVSFISGFDKLGIVQLLVYLGFWVVATLVAPSFRKP